ncbi:MAG: mechanosensitive ion channel family protein [Candidimonas sp.]|nr:MAG: mechanosensitive ion channel family protein [Candidimonas sp.]TAM21229.1 MAG: mechanosensitive ion channel family protein [Candidimonas sp.]TAM73747.1 MAG: mechanosensitive ion channel family protein [Candidimonas sp.]
MHEFMSWVASSGTMGLNLVIALAMLVVGWMVSNILGAGVRKAAARSSKIDPTIVPVVRSVVVWTIRGFTLIAVLARFGVQTASIIAVLGAAGLAIGLALQGTLQNIAAGIMLLALRPLRAGEYVSVVGKAEGTVEEVGLFLTQFRQFDGIQITLPNSLVWGNPIVNYSRNATRRLDIQVGVRYGDDLELALETLRKLVVQHKLALPEPKPQVMVNEYRDSTVMINIRVWANGGDYWDLNFDLYRLARQVLEKAGLHLPIPVHELRTPTPGSQAS